MRMVFVIITGLMVMGPGMGWAQDPVRQIIVQGEGRVSAVPDMAVVNLGVQREAREASAAMQAASEAMSQVLARLAEVGVASEDIQTTRIGLDPRWQHSDNGAPPRVTGYVATNDLSVRVRDLDDLGQLLDAIVSDGANTMNGLSFSVSDTQELEAEARKEAVQDARRRAETLADAAGANLGEVISLSEEVSGGGGPQPMMEMAMSDRSSVPMAAGEVDITVSVRVVYTLSD